MRVENGMTLFFSGKDKLSNWYIMPFKVKGITFNCGEQYMMYSKAMLFGDSKIAQEIMNEPDPKEQKALGKQVSGFIQKVWDERCMPILAAGLYHKFTQHKDMLDFILSTNGTILVEASKYDRIWGCGLDENNPKIFDKKNWTGKNMLGDTLTITRTRINSIYLDASPTP